MLARKYGYVKLIPYIEQLAMIYIDVANVSLILSEKCKIDIDCILKICFLCLWLLLMGACQYMMFW